MRAVALLLLIANLVFFAWQFPQQQFQDSRQMERSPSAGGTAKTQTPGEPLMMLKELPSTVAEKIVTVEAAKPPAAKKTPASETAKLPEATTKPVIKTTEPPVVTKTTAVTTPPVPTCWTLGPFADNRQADRGLTILGKEGINAKIQKQSENTLAGYRVQLPAQGTKAAAERTMNELRDRGVKDIALRTDDGAYSVSLGFFTRVESAQQRSTMIGKLGYKALIQKVYREQDSFRLDLYQVTDSSRLDKAWVRVSAAYPMVKRHSMNCPDSR